jgi:hypothetical protein
LSAIGKVLVILWVFQAQSAWACASCGSGGEDPLILYPNEKFKIYQGISSSWNFRNIDADGVESSAGALQRKDVLSLFAGIGFGTRSFVSFGLPILQNSSSESTVTGMGDLGVSGRYSLLMQSLAEPWMPQVQLIIGAKAGNAVSIHDTERSKDLLDVRGSGFDEIRAGVDLWHAMTNWKLGFAQVQVYSFPEKFSGVSYEPGMTSKSVATLGYGFGNAARIATGVLREHKEQLTVAGVEVSGSSQLSHRYFVNADLMLDALTSMRIGFSDRASVFASYNSFSARQVNAALMRAF